MNNNIDFTDYKKSIIEPLLKPFEGHELLPTVLGLLASIPESTWITSYNWTQSRKNNIPVDTVNCTFPISILDAVSMVKNTSRSKARDLLDALSVKVNNELVRDHKYIINGPVAFKVGKSIVYLGE